LRRATAPFFLVYFVIPTFLLDTPPSSRGISLSSSTVLSKSLAIPSLLLSWNPRPPHPDVSTFSHYTNLPSPYPAESYHADCSRYGCAADLSNRHRPDVIFFPGPPFCKFSFSYGPHDRNYSTNCDTDDFFWRKNPPLSL